MADVTATGTRTRSSDEVYLNFIGGQWRQGSSPEWDENRNPARPTEILGRSTRSTAQDVARAAEIAHVAQAAWARKPRPERAVVLSKVAALMRARLETFAKTITVEEGKGLSEARAEVLKAMQALEYVAAEGRRSAGEILPSESPGTLVYDVRVPLGVVGVITPWNFPLFIPVAKIGPALLEGNAVLFKPATLTPASAKLLVFAFEEAGLPSGVLNLVYGPGALTGEALVLEPRVKAISFTGSAEVGQKLQALAGRRLVRLQLDLGGRNAVVVCADADLDTAAEAIVRGAFGGSGQRASATSRVIVDARVHSELREKLVARLQQLKLGDGLTNADALGPIVDMRQYKQVLKIIEEAKADGAKLVCGGEPCTAPGGGHFITPTLFDGVSPAMRLARDEIFGPILALLPVEGFEQAVAMAGQLDVGLASAIYTNDFRRVMRFAETVQTGRLHVNSAGIQAEPQLGGAEFFCDTKTVILDYSMMGKGNA